MIDLVARLGTVSGKKKRKKPREMSPPEVSVESVLRSRDRKNSKGKGSSYERKIAKQFSAWSGEHVRRTPQSGGWSTAKFGVTGDLVCSNPKWPFHIECKKREGWQLDDLITGIRADDTRSIEAWWQQTINSCPKKGATTPLLVFARNHCPNLVLMYLDDLYTALAGTPLTFTVLTCFDGTAKTRVVVPLDAFLAHVRPPKCCKNHKTWRPT